jgi:hypothetical protein
VWNQVRENIGSTGSDRTTQYRVDGGVTVSHESIVHGDVGVDFEPEFVHIHRMLYFGAYQQPVVKVL